MFGGKFQKEMRLIVVFWSEICFRVAQAYFFTDFLATTETGISGTLSLGGKILSLAKKSLSLAKKSLSLALKILDLPQKIPSVLYMCRKQ